MFKVIENFPEYSVNPNGDVFSRISNKILKPVLDRGIGYYLVTLCKNSVHYNQFIHRLVAQTFIPNPMNKPMVNHIDGIKTNNHVTNLEWCTAKENNHHARLLNLVPPPLTVGVKQLDVFGNVLAEFDSIKDAERKTGIANQNIWKVCNGIRLQAGGYCWRYSTSVETIENTSKDGSE